MRISSKFTAFSSTYLHNKNVLEYAQIMLTDGNFWIHHIVGHSIVHPFYERHL